MQTTIILTTSVQSNLTKGRIADLSPLASGRVEQTVGPVCLIVSDIAIFVLKGGVKLQVTVCSNDTMTVE